MKDNENIIFFKFSVNRDTDSELAVFLKSIPSKNERGAWIRKALKAYMEIERAGLYGPAFESLLECIKKLSR